MAVSCFHLMTKLESFRPIFVCFVDRVSLRGGRWGRGYIGWKIATEHFRVLKRRKQMRSTSHLIYIWEKFYTELPI